MITELKHDHRLGHAIGMSMLRSGSRAPRPDAEVLVEKALSNRRERRLRARDSAANGKKSRRAAFKQRTEARHVEQNLRGMARVYLHGAGTPAMRENVRRNVDQIAHNLAGRDGVEFGDALIRVEEELGKILAAYDEYELV